MKEAIPGDQAVDRPPDVPRPQIVYGTIVYWITIVSAFISIVGPALAMVFVNNNVLNPQEAFSAVLAGMSPEEVWRSSRAEGFPGGHFYLGHMFAGDGFTQFGLAIGCAAALPGLLGAAATYLRSRSIGFALLALWVAFMIAFAAVGVLRLH